MRKMKPSVWTRLREVLGSIDITDISKRKSYPVTTVYLGKVFFWMPFPSRKAKQGLVSIRGISIKLDMSNWQSQNFSSKLGRKSPGTACLLTCLLTEQIPRGRGKEFLGKLARLASPSHCCEYNSHNKIEFNAYQYKYVRLEECQCYSQCH